MGHGFDEPTWWQFALQHIHGHHINDEHPDGALQDVVLRLDKRHRGEALRLQAAAIRIGATQFSIHIRLELLHVEELEKNNATLISIWNGCEVGSRIAINGNHVQSPVPLTLTIFSDSSA